MNIDLEKTLGCDNLSQAYRDAYNLLQPFLMDNERINHMTTVDMSALGLYLGKFAEQEINSSIVQLMRQFCGIEMPEYYCKYCPNSDIDTEVITANTKRVKLNERKKGKYSVGNALQTIPLGEAYYALAALKDNEESGNARFLRNYKFLYDNKFLDTWRMIGDFRNTAAHTGVIFPKKELEKNIKQFAVFLNYMPNLIELKRQLAPEGYVETIIEEDDVLEQLTSKKDEVVKKPVAPFDAAVRYRELLRRLKNCSDASENDATIDALNKLINTYSFNSIIFSDANGKKGMKDVFGNILVPARYEEIEYTFNSIDIKIPSIFAKRNGKYCIVKTDGSGTEIVPPIYDDMFLLPIFVPGFLFKKNGSTAVGVVRFDGKEIIDCIIDSIYEPCQSLYFKSGGYLGMWWQYSDLIIPPIYDNIEMVGELEDPLLFTLNGVPGYVRREDGKFVAKSEVDAIDDEDARYDIMFDFVCEQID